MAMPSDKGEYLVSNNTSSLLRSSFRSSEFSIQWTIEDFCYFGQTDVDFLESPKYYFVDNNSSWWLKVFPYHRPTTDEATEKYPYSYTFEPWGQFPYQGDVANVQGVEYVSISVHTTLIDKSNVNVKLCLINSEKKCTHCKIIDFKEGMASCPDFVTRAELLDETKGLLANGSLSLRCEIKILGSISHSHCGTQAEEKRLNIGRLPKNSPNSLVTEAALKAARLQLKKRQARKRREARKKKRAWKKRRANIRKQERKMLATIGVLGGEVSIKTENTFEHHEANLTSQIDVSPTIFSDDVKY